MSLLFTPFRSLALVSSPVPFSVQRRGVKYFVTTAADTSFQIFDTAKLRLKFVGPTLPAPVTALASSQNLTFAAAGGEDDQEPPGIWVCERGQTVCVLRGHAGKIDQLLPFGKGHLLSLSVAEGALMVWDVEGQCQSGSIEFEAGFSPCIIAHPDTYLNKIVVGSSEGRVQLWNLRTSKMVYEYENVAGTSPNDSVTSIVQSSVIDVMAVGFQSGAIQVHDMRLDAAIVQFDAEDTVTALSFRSDGTNQLCAGCGNGHMLVFDLDKRELLSSFEAHGTMAVLGAHHLVGEPAMVTMGADNALHVWLFDDQFSGVALSLINI
eukprot:TRINITY_DN60898_c0_g1_i1.p1 TRINITY_DN60898_c0_g1~~TRINITY_DN60898_c0_g1_i1.p1  ORF type:complete len:321 (-),score=76.63 TRINITY_DN60898_c0_g1_i1:95-1057(-)